MKNLFEKLRNFSVTWKFIAAFFAILIIPIIFLGVFLYHQAANSAIEQAQIVMEQNLSQTKNSIMQKVNIIEHISQIVRYNNKLRTFLEYGFKEKDNEKYDYEVYTDSIALFVENILQQNKEINTLRIYMKNPSIPELYDSFYNINRIQNREWYGDFINNSELDNSWHGVHDEIVIIANSNNNIPEPVFSYTSNIMSVYSNKVIALLDIGIREDNLFDILEGPATDKFGKVFVVDSNGVISSDNYPDLFNENIATFGVELSKNTKTNQIVEINNYKSILISIPLQEIGCYIVGIFPVDNFTGKVKGTIPSIVLVLGVITLLFGIFIFIVTNILLARIKRLVRAMKQVREGSLDISVPVRSEDEFGNLALNFNHMVKRIHNLIETVYKIELMERESELKALQAQINPHFLCNTLSTISWVARKAEYPEIVQIANSLAKFYRLVLSKGDTIISVKDEIDIVKYYLDIQKIRFDDLFDVVYNIDPVVYDYRMVKNILQPLVENALEHGIEPKRAHGTIIIKACEVEKYLIIQIIDDGIGMSKTALNDILDNRYQGTGKNGYAISNIKKRLKMYYGQNHSLDIYSRPGIGTVLTITINKVLY